MLRGRISKCGGGGGGMWWCQGLQVRGGGGVRASRVVVPVVVLRASSMKGEVMLSALHWWCWGSGGGVDGRRGDVISPTDLLSSSDNRHQRGIAKYAHSWDWKDLPAN